MRGLQTACAFLLGAFLGFAGGWYLFNLFPPQVHIHNHPAAASYVDALPPPLEIEHDLDPVTIGGEHE